jgi:predicted ATP-grasp superfamily ATP-dependent carboligase
LLLPCFRLAIPSREALHTCLDKGATHESALKAGVPSPTCREVRNAVELAAVAESIRFPCVLKPVEAHHWRKGKNWELVGSRKVAPIGSREELIEEYERVSRAGGRVLVQEMVAGGDDALYIYACYMDAQSQDVGFHVRKRLQIPEVFGTGCIVETIEDPGIRERTVRLLSSIGFRGIAEVEYKWSEALQDFQLIEVNARPWDQHRLGNACGVDLPYVAYCHEAGLPLPAPVRPATGHKWIAEDVFLMEALRLTVRRNWGRLRHILGLARGRRIYGIWLASDPVPFLVYVTTYLIPQLVSPVWSMARSVFDRSDSRNSAVSYGAEIGRKERA